MLIKLSRIILALMLIFHVTLIPNIAHANTPGFTGSATYTPDPTANDVWSGGKLSLKNEFKVKKVDIQDGELLNKVTKFKIVWKLPPNLTQADIATALSEDSYVLVGTQKGMLKPENFTTTAAGDLEYVLSDKTFNLLALIAWLLTLLLNPDVTIQTNIELDIAKLPGSVNDYSPNKVLTKGKLPPRDTKTMAFTTEFINVKDVSKGDFTSNLATWNTYLSPWNQVVADSTLNGKNDIIPLEVNGISRVLQGTNYKTRNVQLPIKQNIDISTYQRTVNLFSKTAILGTNNGLVQNRAPVVEDKITELANGKKQLIRQSTYNLFGTDGTGTTLSPVPLVFKQETLLDFKLADTQLKIPAGKETKLKGLLESEGTDNKFYYKINGGAAKDLTAIKLDGQNYEFTLPGFSTGTYNVVIGVSNEYKLGKEVGMNVVAQQEELKISSITDTLDFGTHEIPKPGDIFYSETPFLVKVLDTQLTLNKWKVALALESAFQTVDGSFLPADVFLAKNGQKQQLTTSLIDVYENTQVNNKVVDAITFKEHEGIHIQMKSSNVLLNREYKGTLKVVLKKGP